jgi:hypothetical protein
MVFTAHESITVADTAIGLTDATIVGQQKAFLTVETADIRFTADGTTPTTTVGHLASPGDIIELERDELPRFLAIRTGASATLKASYGY